MCVQAPLGDMEIVKDHRVLSVCLVVQPKFQDVIFFVFRLGKRLFKDSKSRESTKKATCETGVLGTMKILVIREAKNSASENDNSGVDISFFPSKLITLISSATQHLHVSFVFHDVILLPRYSTQKIHKRISASLSPTVRRHQIQNGGAREVLSRK